MKCAACNTEISINIAHADSFITGIGALCPPCKIRMAKTDTDYCPIGVARICWKSKCIWWDPEGQDCLMPSMFKQIMNDRDTSNAKIVTALNHIADELNAIHGRMGTL